MSQFIIATDSHVIRKSDVVIVSPLKSETAPPSDFYFNVTVAAGFTVNIHCRTDDLNDAHIQRDAFIRSLT